MRTTHVFLIVATVLASFAYALPAGRAATCIQNSGRCSDGAVCVQNDGSCSGSGVCGYNGPDGTASCSGGICGSNNHEYATCSGGVCGTNDDTCSGGVCGVNHHHDPDGSGGVCSGGVCGDNNGGTCSGGTCVYNTGACNGGICVYNTGTCNAGGICVINSGVCGSGYGGTIGGNKGCHATTAITLTHAASQANVNNAAVGRDAWTFNQVYLNSAATPNTCFSDATAVSAGRAYTDQDSSFEATDSTLLIRHVTQDAGQEPVFETTTLSFAQGGAYFAQTFQSANGQVLWQGAGFLPALADPSADTVTIGHP